MCAFSVGVVRDSCVLFRYQFSRSLEWDIAINLHRKRSRRSWGTSTEMTEQKEEWGCNVIFCANAKNDRVRNHKSKFGPPFSKLKLPSFSTFITENRKHEKHENMMYVLFRFASTARREVCDCALCTLRFPGGKVRLSSTSTSTNKPTLINKPPQRRKYELYDV